MFRAGGQSKTGLHALTHVAWGTSVGGLVLIAEERRRRVALAQKIVENGKKLQAYTSYAGMAAVAEFDLGRHCEADSPPLEEHISNDDGSKSLTNHEWRTTRRRHKKLPNTQTETGYHSQDVADNTVDRSQTISKKESKSQASIAQHLPFDRVAKSCWRPAISQYTPSAFAAPSEHPPTTISTTQSPYTKERSQIFQDIIAGRVMQCLSDEDSKLRAAGYHELCVFFKTPHNDLGKQMRQAVQKAYSMPKSEQEDYFTLEVRENMTASLQAPDQRVQDVEMSTDDHAGKADDQSRFASRIIVQVRKGRLDVAFFEFLALCEKATTPLGHPLRCAIELLVKSFREENLYSVVADIYLRAIRYLKDFELLRRRKDDLYWLLDGSTSRINLNFSKIFLASLAGLSGPQSIGSLSRTFLQWFSIHAPLQDTVALLSTLDDLKLGIRMRRLLQATADELTQRAFRTGNLDAVTDVMLLGARRHGGALCTAGQLKVTLVHLLETGRTADATELYLACERRSVPALNAKDYLKFDLSSSTGVHVLNQVLTELYHRQGFNAIIALDGAIEDKRAITKQNLEFLYRALMETTSIVRAPGILERLKHSDISTTSDVIREGHAILLRRCWKITRNLDMTEQIFDKIQSLNLLSSENHHIFDEMIHVCVQAYDMDRAKRYAARMLKMGIAVTPRTMTGFMLAHAMQGEWTRVRTLMNDLKQQVLPATTEVTANVFDYIYIQHAEQHTPAESVVFVSEIVELFDTQPSVTMSRHTTDIIVKSEDIILLQQWFAFLSQRGQTPWLSSEAISLLLHRISLQRRLKFHAALQTQEMLDLVQGVTNPDLLEHKLSAAQKALERSTLDKPHTEAELDAKSRSSTQKEMLRALAMKRPDDALATYKSSLVEGLPTEPVNLNIAIFASFKRDSGGYETAQQLVDSAQEAGLHVTSVDELFLAQSFKHRKLTFEEAQDIVFSHYRTLVETHRKPSQFIAVAAARNLFLQGQNVNALRLLHRFRKEFRKHLPSDLIAMTLKLRIHIKHGSMRGVLILMTLVLEHDMRIDTMFIRALQQGRQLYGDNAAQHWGPDMGSDEAKEAFKELLNECIAIAQLKWRVQRKQSLVFAQKAVRLLKTYGDEKRTLAIPGTAKAAGCLVDL